MLVKIDVEIPARKESRVEAVVCDMCKKEHKGAHASESSPEVEWEFGYRELSKTTVSIEKGISYGSDGGEVQTLSVHICPGCFNSQLIPWMLEKGCTLTEGQVDW